MNNSTHTPFRFNNQTSTMNTPLQIESTPQNAANLKQTPVIPKGSGTQGGRRNVGQLFIPVSSIPSTPVVRGANVVQQAPAKAVVVTPQQSVPHPGTLIQGTPVKQVVLSPAAPTTPVVRPPQQLFVNTSSGPQVIVIRSPCPPQTVVVAPPPPPQTVIITRPQVPQGTPTTQPLVLPKRPNQQTFFLVSRPSGGQAVHATAGQQRFGVPLLSPNGTADTTVVGSKSSPPVPKPKRATRQKRIAPSPIKAAKSGTAEVIDLSSPCRNGQTNQRAEAISSVSLKGALGESGALPGKTLASKLAKFCYQKRETNEVHAIDYQTLPTDNRLKPCDNAASIPFKPRDNPAVNLSIKWGKWWW